MKTNSFTPPKLSEKVYSSERILSLLDKSISTFRATYILGLAGLGKTTYMADWVSKRKQLIGLEVYWVDCKEATESMLEEVKHVICEENNPVLLVIDHYEQIAFGALDHLLISINQCLKVGSRCCYISKGNVPDYVIGEIAMQQSNTILGLELLLNDKEVRQYINEYKNCDLKLGNIDSISCVHLCPITLNLMVMDWEKYHHEFSIIMEDIKNMIIRYIWDIVTAPWTLKEREVIKRLYPFKKITKDIIHAVYGNLDNYSVVEELSNQNCFIFRNNGEFVISKRMRYILEERYSAIISKEELIEINKEAINYYKSKNEYEAVIALCIKIEEYEEALATINNYHFLTSTKGNSRMYLEYLRQIPDENIAHNTEAVFWLAVNSLVDLDLVKFAKWYGIFVDYYNSAQMTADQWLRMDVMFSFLKIISPYTTVKEFLHFAELCHGRYTLDHITKELFKYKSFDMVVFLLMRRWNLEDGLAKLENNPIVEEFVGVRLYALLMVHLGGCYCKAYLMEDAQNCLYIGTQGCRQTGMIGPGLFGELYMMDAQRSNNVDKYDILSKKEVVIRTALEKEEYLRTIDTFYIRISMLRHNRDRINKWLAEWPNDYYEDYSLLNVRSYLQQVRALMLVENLYTVQIVLDKLLQYFEELHFEMDRTECYVLYSILCYRRNMMERSMQLFLKAYWLVKKYRFANIIVNEGIAIQPVMELVATRLADMPPEEYFQKILTRVNLRAKYYPKYLVPETMQKEVLTKTEVEILMELDSENTLAQIADKRCISLNTIKQHTKSIYSKLKVNKRNMAIKVAKERGLI